MGSLYNTMKQSLIVAALVASASAFAPASRPITKITALNAEIDVDSDMAELKKEAEERLDGKVAELMSELNAEGRKIEEEKKEFEKEYKLKEEKKELKKEFNFEEGKKELENY